MGILGLFLLGCGLGLIVWRNKRIYERAIKQTVSHNYMHHLQVKVIDWLIFVAGIVVIVVAVSVFFGQLTLIEDITLFIVILIFIEGWGKIKRQSP